MSKAYESTLKSRAARQLRMAAFMARLPNMKPSKANANFKTKKRREPKPTTHVGTLKERTRRKSSYAILRGRIPKKPCLVCGEIKAEAHHNNYNDPYDITWLCRKHHFEEHRRLNASKKFTKLFNLLLI